MLDPQRKGEPLTPEQWLSWATHELRNPLAAIVGAMQVLQNTSPGPELVAELYEIISRQTAHMQQVLETVSNRPQASSGSGDSRPAIPAASPEIPQDISMGSPAPIHHAPWRVLVIDDRRDVRITAERFLSGAGFEVRGAADGSTGLTLAQQFAPHAVLCDISLPDIEGYEIARQLASQPSGRPQLLIAMTGYSQPEDQQRSLDAGFDDHLTKPLDFPQIVEMLRAKLPSS